MYRCGSGFLLTLAITFVVAFTGCLGKSTNNPGNGGVTSVTLSPGGTISIEAGSTQVFSATGKNANGRAVLGIDIQYLVVSGNPNAPAPISIASTGNACAGTWDPTATMCSPGSSGIALVSAVVNGVNSPQTTIYVHQHIDSLQVSPLNPQGPPQYECFSQGQIWNYQAIAYSQIGGQSVDITTTVGPMNWFSKNTGVVSTSTTVAGLLPNQVQVTAKTPGITELFANVSGVTSNYYAFTTCLVQAIWLQIGGQNEAGNSITVNNGNSVPVTAVAVDTLCGTANNTPLTSLPLTWSTSDPEVIAFVSNTASTASNSATARNNSGGAVLTASCAPPTCNIGLPGLTPSGAIVPSLPIYASNYDAAAPPPTKCQPPNLTKGYSTISVDVIPLPTAKPLTYTAWAATTSCGNAIGCTSAIFAVTPGTNPIGKILDLPRTPNSMMFNHVASARVYIGSDQGLMYIDVTGTSPSATLVSNSSTCNIALCGTVLTISNDGKMVVVSDPPTPSSPGQVYIYTGGATTAPVDLILSDSDETATAAAFSLDQLKLFILTNLGNMYVYSAVDALSSVSTFAPGTDVEFSADGSFAYVAGAPAGAGAPANAVSAYSTCSLPGEASVNIGTAATSATPLKLFPSPVIPLPFEQTYPPLNDSFFWTTQTILALEPPNIEFLTAEFTQNPILYPTVAGNPLQFTCNPPLILPGGFTKGASYNLGQGNFTPIYSQLVNDGAQLIVVAQNVPAVLLFNVANGTTTSVPLVNNAYPLSASASTDGSQVFVAACDQYPNNDPTQPCALGSVHMVNTVSQGDYQQVPYVNVSDNNDRNMCNNGGNPVPQCLPNLIALRPN